MQTHSPIKRLFHKLENSIQMYIKYHKTHAMATRYGGVGHTSMEDPEIQDLDNASQDDFPNENIIQNLLHKTECLKQAVEDRDNDPREAIQQLEQRLNRLTLTLHPSSDPIEEMLGKYTKTLCIAQKRKHLWKVLCYKIFPP